MDALFQPYFDELIAFASAEPRKQDLLAAKAEYFKLTGEVFEDDKVFELRMASFLDYYLFDRPNPSSGRTPAAEYLELKREKGPPEAVQWFEAFTSTLHGLFEVRKLKKGIIRLRDLHTGKDHDVSERRQMVGLEKGDILEARLIPTDGQLIFSAAFCYHARAATKIILKEVKRRKKKEPDRSPKELTWECAKMALKVERYRQIPIEKLYDFELKKL